jgi:hypothetical protein
MDEKTDKYSEALGIEADLLESETNPDPIRLGLARTKTFPKKLLFVSTPSVQRSEIWSLLNSCEERIVDEKEPL